MPQVQFPLHQHAAAPQVISDADGRPVLEARSVGLNEYAIPAEEVARQIVQALENGAAWQTQFLRACDANLAATRDNGRLRAALIGLRGVVMVCEDKLAWVRRELLAAAKQVDEAFAGASAAAYETPAESLPCQPPKGGPEAVA